MNEMELLRELAQETPLPAPAELDPARARLAAAIAADPVRPPGPVRASAPARPPEPVQPSAPVRPPAPGPVLTAVKLMYAGAVGTAVYLIIALLFIGDSQAYHVAVLGHRLSAAQLSLDRPLIVTLTVVAGLVVIALWLWMARAVGQGRNWARILSTVLLGLATLELLGNHGVAQVFCAALTWLTGLVAVWLLWRPAAGAYFTRQALDGTGAGASGPAGRRP